MCVLHRRPAMCGTCGCFDDACRRYFSITSDRRPWNCIQFRGTGCRNHQYRCAPSYKGYWIVSDLCNIRMFTQYRRAYGAYAAILPEELEQVHLQRGDHGYCWMHKWVFLNECFFPMHLFSTRSETCRFRNDADTGEKKKFRYPEKTEERR